MKWSAQSFEFQLKDFSSARVVPTAGPESRLLPHIQPAGRSWKCGNSKIEAGYWTMAKLLNPFLLLMQPSVLCVSKNGLIRSNLYPELDSSWCISVCWWKLSHAVNVCILYLSFSLSVSFCYFFTKKVMHFLVQPSLCTWRPECRSVVSKCTKLTSISKYVYSTEHLLKHCGFLEVLD